MHSEAHRDEAAGARGATVLSVLGRAVRPLERIAAAGQIVGLTSRATSYRMAASDSWPLVGPESSRWVLMIPLLERYGIPYTVGFADSATAASEGTEA